MANPRKWTCAYYKLINAKERRAANAMMYWFSNTILAGVPEWLLWLLAGLAFNIGLYLAGEWFGD